jgi:hypothetical protein
MPGHLGNLRQRSIRVQLPDSDEPVPQAMDHVRPVRTVIDGARGTVCADAVTARLRQGIQLQGFILTRS